MPPQSDYDKWFKMSEMLREDDVTSKTLLKDIEKFMKNVLPETPVPKFETRDRITTTPFSVPVKRRVLEYLPSTSAAAETVYESTPRIPKFDVEIYEEKEVEADDGVEEDVGDFGELASPYLTPSLQREISRQTIRYSKGRLWQVYDWRFHIVVLQHE